MIFLILLIASYHLNSINCINSYIYLNDKSINEEIAILQQKEEVELNRDWSAIDKLNSSNLKSHKNV